MEFAICDDEPLFIEKFRRQLSGCLCLKGLDYSLSVFTDGGQLISSDRSFDILFLDIKMNGHSGLDTARQLRSSNCDTMLVFLTAYKQYVFDAFDVDASQYLVKPVDTEKLNKVLSRLISRVSEKNRHVLTIRRNFVTSVLPVSDIYYVEVMDKKAYAHTKGGEVIDFYESMDRLERMLPDWFFRCHRSYIVNLDSVMKFDRNSIFLSDGACIPLSKRKYNDFSMAFMKRMRRE